ncbi:MAG TPA: beta-galactosidase [Pirellulales bacterium]|nr:beta-galactosidase [Pirellulales bacterium]
MNLRLITIAIVAVALRFALSSSRSFAETHEINLAADVPSANLTKFVFGASQNPAGVEIAADGVSLLEDGQRMTPVMGEFHYSRYPRGEWRDELLKMKAGGVDVVTTYVFWIHHEEQEGTWDWTGDRDLRAFVNLCGELGLRCVIRCGPWDHGEVRNGGFPEWMLDKNLKLRTNDPEYLNQVRLLYGAIAEQLRGLFWKDGGPVIAVQIENEYRGDPDHLLKLKQMARESGLDVPLYTRTGWPTLKRPIPFGELLPLYGGYAEGFWDRDLSPMPGRYWKEFVFKRVRTDTAIASEHFGNREAQDDAETGRYPYFTCEIGAGMASSYHRRITEFPMDALSLAIVKLGSGSNLLGYYMYHGGTNPTGRESWLQENQASRYTNYNDLPVKSYDFQTALGEFGQEREQYHLLRLVHLFLRDFGSRLAPMYVVLPNDEVSKQDDTHTFRWAARTDGHSGFVFVNNYQRLLHQPDRPYTQLKLILKDGELTFPQVPVTVAADCAFFWPFNFDLGDDVTLEYATAQPVCQIRDNKIIYTVFAQTGNSAEFAFAGQASADTGLEKKGSDHFVLAGAAAGTTPIVTLIAKNGVTHKIILLDEATAKSCYKATFAGADRLLLAPKSTQVLFDNDVLRLITSGPAHDLALSFLPNPTGLRVKDQPLNGVADGAFTRYALAIPESKPVMASVRLVKEAGPPRTVEIGKAKVAIEPSDADFEAAAVWEIKLPQDIDPTRKLLLRIHYTGDVARAYLGDTLLTDNFYNGTPFEVGLTRYGPEIYSHGIILKVLPLQKGAPIYLQNDVRPEFDAQQTVVSIDSVETIELKDIEISGK